MTFNEMKKILKKDINVNFYGKKIYLKAFVSDKGRFLVMFRLNKFLELKKGLFFKILKKINSFFYNRIQKKRQLHIPIDTFIGEGICFPHLQCIVINPRTKIGNNCRILHNVTIGNNPNKGKDLLPIIEDGVVITVGVAIIGPVKIGKNSIIGANSVVIKDVKENSIVGGVPAKLIK